MVKWYTRRVQNAVSLVMWRFESSLGHENLISCLQECWFDSSLGHLSLLLSSYFSLFSNLPYWDKISRNEKYSHVTCTRGNNGQPCRLSLPSFDECWVRIFICRRDDALYIVVTHLVIAYRKQALQEIRRRTLKISPYEALLTQLISGAIFKKNPNLRGGEMICHQ